MTVEREYILRKRIDYSVPLTYPTAGDVFQAGDASYITWYVLQFNSLSTFSVLGEDDWGDGRFPLVRLFGREGLESQRFESHDSIFSFLDMFSTSIYRGSCSEAH